MSQTLDAVDVAPFAVRREWITPTDYEVWWEDPRDLFEVVVEFAPGTAPDPQTVRLEYWQHSWPKVRVPKGAPVGAGRGGWLAIDDWTNGRWQVADHELIQQGDFWTYTFRPLNAREFPGESDFPATFRRTLKLALRSAAPCQIQTLRAYTDSEWREAEVAIEWEAQDDVSAATEGRLEAYNGEILTIRPLVSSTLVLPSYAWRSAAADAKTGGIVARVRYSHNEDSNSYDRTIVTMRAGPRTFSFAMDDLLANGPIYVRDLGALVSRADAHVRLREFAGAWERQHGKTIYQRVAEIPEQSWERAWNDMPPKRRFYFVLGCEGGRQKFGVDPTGEIFLGENFIRRVPGKDTPRLGWDGQELRFRFGLPVAEPGDRSLLDGHLPVIRTTWAQGSLSFEQEAYAIWLFGDVRSEHEGDDPVVAMVRFRLANLAQQPAQVSLPLGTQVDQVAEPLTVREGLVFAQAPTGERLRCLFDTNGAGTLRSQEGHLVYELTLSGASAHTIYVKIPFVLLTAPAEIDRLRRLDYEAEKARVAEFWRRRIAQGAQIETPNATINDFYRTHLMHMLVVDVMIDGGHAWDLKGALRMAEVYARYGVLWLEEPLHPDDWQGYRELVNRSPVAIAAGEQESGRRAFERLLDETGLDILQPDLARCGGITEAKKIAYMAHDRRRKIVPHAFKTGILLAASAHFAAAIPNGFMIEYSASTSPLTRDLVRDPVQFQDGYVIVPEDGVGLGISLDERVLERYRVA